MFGGLSTAQYAIDLFFCCRQCFLSAFTTQKRILQGRIKGLFDFGIFGHGPIADKFIKLFELSLENWNDGRDIFFEIFEQLLVGYLVACLLYTSDAADERG